MSLGLPDPATLWPILIACAIFLLVGFPIHEFSHALVADRLGDRTARFMGRLSLNPIVHFDPMGGTILVLSAIFFGFVVGWAKPTPVNPSNLQGGRRGEAWVALAGPASNLIMASIFAIPLRFLSTMHMTVPDPVVLVLENLVWFNVFLFLFNLLPIPPLDGYRVLTGLVDASTAYRLRQLERYGFVLILFIFLFGARILLPIGNGIYGFLVGQ